MTPDADADERQLTSYLLGQLPAEQAATLEERYFGDPELHDRLCAVERDLIDRYVRGDLTDVNAFERQYLVSPSRRARVEFARALMQASTPFAGESGSVDRGAFRSRHVFGVPAWQLAAGVAIAVAGAWLVLSLGRGGPVPQDAPDTAVSSGIQVPAASTPQPTFALLVLVPSAVRASGVTPTLTIGAETHVRIQLEMDAVDYPRYRVSVRVADGIEIWREDGLAPTRSASGPNVVTTVPAERLVEGDYTVRVGGLGAQGEVEEVGGYTFRVLRP